MFTIFADGKAMPVFIIGSVHGEIQDGDAYALLNPDMELLDRLKAGDNYSALIREVVAGKCDGMVNIWLDAYVDGVVGLRRWLRIRRAPYLAPLNLSLNKT